MFGTCFLTIQPHPVRLLKWVKRNRWDYWGFEFFSPGGFRMKFGTTFRILVNLTPCNLKHPLFFFGSFFFATFALWQEPVRAATVFYWIFPNRGYSKTVKHCMFQSPVFNQRLPPPTWPEKTALRTNQLRWRVCLRSLRERNICRSKTRISQRTSSRLPRCWGWIFLSENFRLKQKSAKTPPQPAIWQRSQEKSRGQQSTGKWPNLPRGDVWVPRAYDKPIHPSVLFNPF